MFFFYLSNVCVEKKCLVGELLEVRGHGPLGGVARLWRLQDDELGGVVLQVRKSILDV